jgi:hypothetical protein
MHSLGRTFHSTTRLFLLLTIRKIVFNPIGCSWVRLVSAMLFGSGIGVGIGTRCTIREGIPFILPWSADLGIIPGTDGIGSNRPWHDHDSSHGSLIQVDLGAKRLHDC